MKKSRLILSFLLIFCTLLLLAACGGCAKQDENKTKVVFNLRSEGKTMDPQLAANESSSKILAACMEGLVRQGEKSGKIIPAVAEKWETSEDGLTWTFHLRKNAKWSNDEPVTANDFHYAITRLFEPMFAAEGAYLLYCIKNSEEYPGSVINN